MDAKYRIGNISQLLNIPAQTLRFYEEKGIIHASRSDENGYRFYDIWDVNYIMDIMFYRSMGFSLEQIKSILADDSNQDIIQAYSRRETELLQTIASCQNMLQVVSRQKNRLQKIDRHLGKFSLSTSPELIFYRYRFSETFQSLKSSKIQDLQGELKQWTNVLPQARVTFSISYETLSGPEKEIRYAWGWSLPAGTAIEKGFDSQPPNEYLPPRTCLYTIFSAGGKNTFIQSFCQQVMPYLQEHGYTITGDPFGEMLSKPHENQELKRYFELWVPIEP